MSTTSIPDHSIRICADRGGTFCDVHASYPDPKNPNERKEIVVKLLSQDPLNYKDAPTEGIRRILEALTGESIPRGQTLKTDKIGRYYIRLSTTVATNALLERKGKKHALLITKGFRDLLLIGNQSRPKIFDLNIRRPPPLYSTVLEVDERVTLVGYTSDPNAAEHAVQFDENGKIVCGYNGPGWDENDDDQGEIVRGLSGEAVRIIKKPELDTIRKDLEYLFSEAAGSYRSLAIVFAHSYTYPDHELAVGRIASEIGFTQISMSSQLLPMIKMVPRGVSCTADAYLTPVLRKYLDGFFGGFDEELKGNEGGQGGRKARVEFMASDGGLLDLDNFSGLRSLLSGPAGGVVGYALTSWDAKRKVPIIGIDVGGTSTDVSRFDGRYEVVYETTTASISIQSPQLDINTVAAGGGSCLTLLNGLFRAGPESAGADPGPVCYRKGGPLAITDANLLLGRLIPDYFPKIFGRNENEGLDVEATRAAFVELAREVNESYAEGSRKALTLDEIVYGFIKVANETMCRPIRALTEAKGYALSKHVLASFGGAGGQHATEIARLLGIQKILIHRHSSILSAYGLALADRAYELQEPSAIVFGDANVTSLKARLDDLSNQVLAALEKQGFTGKRVRVERMLNMRFDGTDTAVMVPQNAEGPNEIEIGREEDFGEKFNKMYKDQFGFVLEGKDIIVDDIKVRGIGKTFDFLGPSVWDELDTLKTTRITPDSNKVEAKHSVYFEGPGRIETPVYLLDKLHVGDQIHGPAMILDSTQTIVLDPYSQSTVTKSHLYIELK
ncbi:5-oxoprolinase [Cantharellus anzutake]|uniref:5-oxoprolinase n=1 Tax=Cantharellus anzutake TaxID=1750568 RepID=UPI001907E572|nr:5-oxoprolinase [Cantharellus anzutake]KAF8327936.1 5-oxoprolinase [Cantharellus anzutake]